MSHNIQYIYAGKSSVYRHIYRYNINSLSALDLPIREKITHAHSAIRESSIYYTCITRNSLCARALHENYVESTSQLKPREKEREGVMAWEYILRITLGVRDVCVCVWPHIKGMRLRLKLSGSMSVYLWIFYA